MQGSVISAMVAQLLQNVALSLSPWEATAALYVLLSLSIVAVVTALHHTIFLNSASFQPSVEDKLKCIFNLQRDAPRAGNRVWRRRVWLGTFIYSIPQVLLSYSIFGSFVGMGLIGISPFWTRDSDDVRDGPQKVSSSVVSELVRPIHGPLRKWL
jgi:hypothetical protein